MQFLWIFFIYRSSDRGKFRSNLILLWTASNACASVRQMSLAWVCGKERNQHYFGVVKGRLSEMAGPVLKYNTLEEVAFVPFYFFLSLRPNFYPSL